MLQGKTRFLAGFLMVVIVATLSHTAAVAEFLQVLASERRRLSHSVDSVVLACCRVALIFRPMR